MLTLAQARSLLSSYVGANLDFNTRLYMARERLLKAGNWSSTKQQVLFNAYPDASGHGFITLPYNMQTVLSIARQPQDNTYQVGYPLRTRGLWYEFIQSGPGVSFNQQLYWSRGLVPINNNFTTFIDWSTGMKMRLKFETSEDWGLFIFRGVDANGQPIWSVINGVWGEGVPLGFSGTTTVTTTAELYAPPYSIIKPVTKGRVYLYAVDESNNETLAAIYQPEETCPAWRRYKIPVDQAWTSSSPGKYVAVVKLALSLLESDYDPVFPSNIGALREELEALNADDAQDDARATRHRLRADKYLADEVNDDTGYGADDVVQLSDDFHVAGISYGL